MSLPYPAQEQAIVANIVRQPQFKALFQLPVIAWQQIGLVALVYVTVLGGIALHLQGSYPYWALLITSAMASYAAFTPLHDATHRAVSSNGFVNDLIGTLSAQILIPGATCSVYRYLHLEHHRHTGDPVRDPDESMVSSSPLKRFFVIAFVDVHWLIWYFRNPIQRSTLQKAMDLFTLGFVLLWYVGWFTSPYAQEFFWLFWLPQRLGILTVAYLFASIQHPEGELEYQRPFQATRMFHGGWILRTLMISQSQHLMHHLFPALPYYRYNDAWRLSEPSLKDQGLIWDWPVGKRRLADASNVGSSSLLKVVITQAEPVAENVMAYQFAPVAGSLPPFEPGAHIDVHLGTDDTGHALVRQYSLTGVAENGHYSIAVKREADGRGGSARVHEQFKVGHEFCISRPRNLFSLEPENSSAVLLAGGIGITPLISMATELHARGVNFTFHAFAQSEAALPFNQWMTQQAWSQQVQRWTAGQYINVDTIPSYQAGAHMYLCGPAGFMEAVVNLAQQQGWPEQAVHSEQFSNPLDNENNRAFTVELARSKQTITVAAEESLLEALQANNVSIAASCVQGLCGTCSCTVLDGEVEHRDQFYTDQERRSGLMTACVSRAKGEHLVLDI